MKHLYSAVSLLLVLSLTPALAEVPAGYQQLAAKHGVPPAILYAVALTESGAKLTDNRFRPWPWTLNVEGEGHYFSTRRAAYTALTAHQNDGGRSIDIGLMQVNWRYHRARLRDAWQALDPYFNLDVGAQILRERYREHGDWWQAVGRYHSSTLERAERYRKRVRRHWQKVRAQ